MIPQVALKFSADKIVFYQSNVLCDTGYMIYQ